MLLGGGKLWVGCWFDWLTGLLLLLLLVSVVRTRCPASLSSLPPPTPLNKHPPIFRCGCVCVWWLMLCESQLVNVRRQWSKQSTSVDVFDKHAAELQKVRGQGWWGICHLIARLQLVATNEARLITLIGCCCPALKCHCNWNCSCANAHAKKLARFSMVYC